MPLCMRAGWCVMGWTWEVHAWVMHADGSYSYESAYQGESLVGAIRAMRQAKRVSGCVRLEWR